MQNLEIYAEIFIGFVGFSGIVAALGAMNNRNWTVVDKTRFILLIGSSFLGVFLSLIPGVIQQFNAGEKPNWQIATGIFCTISSIALISVVLLFKRNNVFKHPDFSMRFMVTAGSIMSTFILGVGLSALGVYFEASMGIYMVGLMCVMFISASMFGLLIKFILRGVRDQQ
jgi:uncharacterized membrane protein YozB (DUF420 family)